MNIKSCPTCSNPIPLAAPGGFCPTCLLREAAEPLSTGQTAPSLEDVAIAFPGLEILSLIGQGGMGAVYKVRQPSLDRIVALKILSPELSRDPAFAERFAREARVLGKLNHPNIVTVYEHGESGGYYFVIMEYVDGVNLRQAMRAGRFTPEQALSIVPGICDALQAAHAQGIWHRDIKPENILLDQRGGVKIADFGIARLVGDQTKNFTLTGTGNALGSIAYMAPEQHESPHTVDHRADIYSLGVVIYEMLTGELPLGRFPAPSQRAAVSARIDEIVFQTLEKERERRHQSATEVKTDVQGATATKDPTKAWTNVPQPPSKQTLISLSLLLLGVMLRFFGYEVIPPSAYLPARRIVVLSTTASVFITLGESLVVFGYIWGLYSLWEMKRGLKPPVWRPLLECVTVIPILFRGLKWWSLHSPRSLRWTFALLLVVGPAIPLIYWLAIDRPTVANSISANFYLWAILVLVAVYGGGTMIWTMILRPDCYPKRAYQVAFWVLALFCAGLAVWLQPLPEPTNSDAWQHTLAYGGICGAAGVSALALLFSPTRWGVVGLVLCSFVLGHDVFRSWAFPSKTDTTNVQALSPDSEAWSYTPRHMTSGEIETWIKSPQSQSNSPHSKNWNFAWTEEMKLQFDDGTVTLTGPKQNVRPLMSWLRMMDSIKVPPPGSTGNNFPPITLGTFVLMALIEGDHFDKAILGSALIKTFQDEKITPPQLARALQSHVLEFESATITGEQKPNSGKLNGLTDATVFEITVPCSDRNDRPLKLSLIEINFGFRKEHKLISLSPWLLEEAKQQSAEPFEIKAVEPKQSPKSVGETSVQPKAADTSGTNYQSLSGSQRSLFTIEAPEFGGSEEFGGCDVQDVVGSIANSLGMILCQNCSLREDHVCHNVCMHNDSGFLVHEIVVQPGRTFDIANFPTEHQQTEWVVELEFIDEMHQQRLDVHTEALFGGRSIHIRAVIRDQKAGIDADHNAMIISKSIRSTHVFKEFVQVLLRQHRFSSAITETSALAPVHSRLLSSQRLADRFSFHHNILATSHPSEDGGQTSLQVV